MAGKVVSTRLFKVTLFALWFTLRNLFRRPVTVQYPAVKRPIPERWRGGTFALTTDKGTGEENCIGCKLCERICPSGVITVEMEKHGGRGWAKSFILDLQACLQCELCVQVCPTDAIVMLHGMEAPVTRREDLILNKEKLMANEGLYRASWATGLKLQELHEPKK
ncbi:MAG TPA: NADH-quinone oxidoreductase subunit I [Thermodesulfobacteriota bacterium]|jgi:NADH-quinone oxidoreductase subunit I|nr:NADH-quinone oxidoreductase subunit I [Thermodesulfobacteriota bacterium]